VEFKLKRVGAVLSWLAYTNIWLSMGLALMSVMSSMLFKTKFEVMGPISSFLIFFALYTLNRQTDFEEDSKSYPKRAIFFKKHGKLLFRIAILSYACAIFAALFLSFSALMVVAIVLIIGIAYSVKCIPRIVSRGFIRLKDIVVVKTLTIAVTWATGTVLLATAYASIDIPNVLILFCFVYVLIRSAINTITFDMRDIRGDSSSGIKTIPVILGINNTKLLLYILNTLLALIVLYASLTSIIGPIGHIINIATLYVYFYIYTFGKKWVNVNFLCDIIVDGEYLLIGALAFLGTVVF
jgi:4-hydroxybenzoate polyprenyltransferase